MSFRLPELLGQLVHGILRLLNQFHQFPALFLELRSIHRLTGRGQPQAAKHSLHGLLASGERVAEFALQLRAFVCQLLSYLAPDRADVGSDVAKIFPQNFEIGFQLRCIRVARKEQIVDGPLRIFEPGQMYGQAG